MPYSEPSSWCSPSSSRSRPLPARGPTTPSRTPFIRCRPRPSSGRRRPTSTSGSRARPRRRRIGSRNSKSRSGRAEAAWPTRRTTSTLPRRTASPPCGCHDSHCCSGSRFRRTSRTGARTCSALRPSSSTSTSARSQPTIRLRPMRRRRSWAPVATRSTPRPRRCSCSTSCSRVSPGSVAAPRSSCMSPKRDARTPWSGASGRPRRRRRRCTPDRRRGELASTGTPSACRGR